MSKSLSPKLRERVSFSTPLPGDLNATLSMDDEAESTMATVAQFVEQLQASISSSSEKELITARVLSLARARKDVRTLIGSHAQAMPLFISILRNGTPAAKVNVADTLSVLCKDDDLRLKVLLGGCIPHLLSLLKSESIEARKAAAEAIYEVSSGGLSDDHVGMKIFVTEGVVPTLWDQLTPNNNQDKVVEGFVTGALRNLCGDKDGYWRATFEAGRVDIIVGLLSSDNATAQSNAASLLARLMLAFSDSIPKVIDSGAVKVLLRLVSRENDTSVRASAADALEALCLRSTEAKKAVVDANGIPILIGAIVAPSKECMQGGRGQALLEHSTRALANICCGMPALILYLGKLSQSSSPTAPIVDIIGALAYTLMVFELKSGGEEEEPFDAREVEGILVTLLKPRDNKLVQDRVLEAMSSLYGNVYLSRLLNHAEAKKVLIGLTTMATVDVQEYLIPYLTSLCCDDVGLWEAISKREGVQMLMSLLGLSSEQHREYVVQLLAILSDQVDDSKWAITAAGGIPPLVQLLETGSQKAKEDAAHVLWNLCCHSEDIRACVESAGAIPAFLWLLKTGGPRGQEASAMALTKLVRTADSATINQLLALLLGDSPSSKAHIIKILGHVLTMASQKDLVQKGSAPYKGLRSLVQVLNSSNEETQEYAASVLADLFITRQDICDSLATDEILHSCMKLLTSNTQVVATQSARALGALSRPTKSKTTNKMSYIAEGDVKPLIKLAKTSSIDAAETAVAALANLLYDPQIAAEALPEDVVSALTRVLLDGTLEGKKNASRALHQLLSHFPVGDVLPGNAQCRSAVLAIVDSLKSMDMDGTDAADALEVVSILARTKRGASFPYPDSSAEVPSFLDPLVRCLAEGPPSLQDKAIEILSKLCGGQSVVIGDLLVDRSRSFTSLANRVMNSASLEVKIGGSVLLICAAKEHRQQSMEALDASGYSRPLVCALAEMMQNDSSCSSVEIEIGMPKGFGERFALREGDDFESPAPSTVLCSTVSLWLLSVIASFDAKNRIMISEAGGLDALSDKLASYSSNHQAEYEDAEGIWISALLLAILFQEGNVISSPTTVLTIPSLALLLRSEEAIDRFFAAQSMASLVCNGSKEISLTIANSGAVSGLISLIGCLESDMPNLVALSEEFSLVRDPQKVVLEQLFNIEDVKFGLTTQKSIPLLVDLLRPIPDRPAAPPIAVKLLICIADGSDTNKLIMAEAGVLDALTKYLSLSPQDSTEVIIAELFRILFSNEMVRNEASTSSLNQLIAVLRLGSRSARFSAARALHELFEAESMRDSELSRQAVQPLVDMLNAASESEQETALVGLIKLASGNSSKAAFLNCVETTPLESLYKILLSASSLELKRNAAQFCFVLFANSKVRANPIVSEFIEPFISLMQADNITAVEAGVCAFEKLLDDEPLVELASAYEVVDLLVGLVSGTNYQLIEASICSLIKLGKDRTPCKLDMVNAGIVDKCLELLPVVPISLCSNIAELFRILTNSSAVARSSASADIVEPLFLVLLRPDFSLWGQHSALQALVNILEKPQSLATLKLTPSQAIEPLISFLESPSQAIQQLGTELLSHLLAQEHFQQDITTKNAVVPLVQLAGIGILSLQQTAIKALESISKTWPKAVADAGGIFELAKVIIQDEPQPSHELLESAALVLSNVLRFNAEYYFKVPVVVLVKMLHSALESTVTVALKALVVHEKSDALSAIQMAEAGAIDSLLDLLRSHQCEEASGQLLEGLFNNLRIREMKVAKYAIAPLSQYLLDPQTRSQPGKLLAALALGDLSQHEALCRASDSVSACRALISLLEDQPTEDMKMVAICALQNFVMRSRTNRRAVAEAGGILIIQELLLSPNPEVSAQAALLIKFLFSNHTLQEYVSNELIRSLTAALERELWSSSTINEEVLRTLNVIFANFPKLHISEAATLCIPNLIGVLKSGTETAQDSVLDTLCFLRQSWATMPIDIAKSQSMIAAEAIPTLQTLMKTCPPSFHERADSLLHCLPGCLTVTIRRGNNLKQAMGSTNAFCRLTIGNGPARQTKVVGHSTSPEWEEGFTWAFDVPPKGQKLHIVCKSKNTFGKSTLGKVTFQIDKVVSEGASSGLFSLNHDANKDGSSRTLEIEIVWSNRISDEEGVQF